MDVREIVLKYLKDNGFDGLQNEGECGCDIKDLFACGDPMPDCAPGYKIIPPMNCEFDYYICKSKDSKPWLETEY